MEFEKNMPPIIFAAQANLAQLVEHFIRNERVVGSNPIVGSFTAENRRSRGFRSGYSNFYFNVVPYPIHFRIKQQPPDLKNLL